MVTVASGVTRPQGQKGRCVMSSHSVSDVGRVDRRRWNRVSLAVPVAMGTGAAEGGEGVSLWTGQTKDLSPTGVYVTSHEYGSIAPGDVLEVSIVVPKDARRFFPFSRILGPCRVVRKDEVQTPQGSATGLALSFCEERMTLLGTVMFTL